MRILVSEKLSENRFKTPEGYLICTNAILARTGKQTYLRREVFGDSCDDGDNEVDRTAEEVFAPETLASFENKPLCVEHPDEDVNADNHNLLSVGYVRDVKKDVVDGNEVMTATLVITDKYGIDEVESGRKTDLSCGYDCDIVDDEHPQQRHIRGNHVAICERGRAGIARIVDSIKDAQHQFEVCYIDYDKRCVVIEANSTDDAIAKFRRKYGMYHIVHVKQIDSMKNMEDNMKKYAEDKHGRTFTLEEIEGGKVKATNMGGREKIFSGWKEAEEEFRKRGITILDAFYDSVEDAENNIDKIIARYTSDPETTVTRFGSKMMVELSERDERNAALINALKKAGLIQKSSFRFMEDAEKDAKYVIMHPRKNLYLTVGGKTWSAEDDPMIKKFDSEKEAEEYAKKNTSDFKIALFDSVKDEDRLWKVYLTGGIDANNIMYVKADNEAMARKIAERNTDEKIIRITEYGDTPLTKIDKERILRNPNRYFDSEKKIEKIAKIVSKLK